MAGGGEFTPIALVVDDDSTTYIVDGGNNCIRRFDINSRQFGSDIISKNCCSNAVGITADNKTLVFAEQIKQNCEARFAGRTQNLVFYHIAGGKVGFRRTLKSSWNIVGLAVVAGGQTVVADAQSGVLHVIDPISWSAKRQFDRLTTPTCIASGGPRRNNVYVADGARAVVIVFDAISGSVIGEFSAGATALEGSPSPSPWQLTTSVEFSYLTRSTARYSSSSVETANSTRRST